MIPIIYIPSPPWQSHESLKHLWDALGDGGATYRFVGGVVRSALAHDVLMPLDIDVAIDQPIDHVAHELTHKGFRVIPTGLSHGTVTVALGAGYHVEITRLRVDVETDGRHATVVPTHSWVDDAYRRDFTINALYADWDGAVYDPTEQGIEDLKQQTVRFIGDPLKRIHEDYLRILRFFRFSAVLGNDRLNDQGLEACHMCRDYLGTLAKERIWHEMHKMLWALFPWASLCAMDRIGILKIISPRMIFSDAMAQLHDLEHMTSNRPAFFPRLGLLVDGSSFLDDYPLPRKIVDRTQLMMAAAEHFTHWNPYDFYRLGGDVYRDVIMIAGARGIVSHDDVMMWVDQCAVEPPVFPVHGHDALALGIQGAKIGDALGQVERLWAMGNFSMSRDECLEILKNISRK